MPTERQEGKEDPAGLSLNDVLWNSPPRPNGNTTHEGTGAWGSDRLLEQYKLVLATTESTSERRLKSNAFFVTLNTAVLAGLTYGMTSESVSRLELGVISAIASLAGLRLCHIWRKMLDYYRALNTAKFKVVGALEAALPASPFWRAELGLLGGGKDETKYSSLAKNERQIASLIACIYATVLLISSANIVSALRTQPESTQDAQSEAGDRED